ncbi:PIR Superfamily Protein [Plasmodium ovale curtisi]|uniref:PIR Superfamily Protein n=1 Tax=Plasmodium ovale curtisi TaxID=864141 RepID=A0A1A8WS24_PLAOA|nr:PIR Superfamily Protein [Plasmodium ovale curtisi]
MTCKKGTSKESYIFLRNSHYYGNLLPGFDKDFIEPQKKEVCSIFQNETGFSESTSLKEICENFMYMYNYLNKVNKDRVTDNTITVEDCHFMNYWLNVNLENNNIDTSICVNDFYDKLKSKNVSFFSSSTKLEDHLHVIDLNVLENMKLLYNLYDNAVKIISIISNKECTNEEQKSCIDHIKECDKKYKEAMDRCFNSNDDFYNALKNFKDGYKIITEPSYNKSNACKYREFYYFPEYDGVLEKKANAIKISSTLLVLSFALPLIYKYTPFGSFLRAKIRMVKNKWMNSDEYGSELPSLPTDVEDNISDNGEYNIGYYSETN